MLCCLRRLGLSCGFISLIACQQNPAPVEHLETIVEKTIRSGMSQVEIIEVIGAPKVIQKGARGAQAGIEIWLFDVKAKSIVRQKQGDQDALIVQVNVDPSVKSTRTTLEVRFDPDGSAVSFSYQEKNF